ncbi:hypothetical protein RHMOL_Rhmol05G0292000 [Rhododendron molle]|uniref:Uncharacterized protein n=1 Tax=Rhododendron molle TaxID=49168 RepID=A0ACC0NU63_RHOML|nr:hypothetical protein RHMOL_Rhmol05G0292000 [Rhododendron molle]
MAQCNARIINQVWREANRKVPIFLAKNTFNLVSFQFIVLSTRSSILVSQLSDDAEGVNHPCL